MAVAAAVEERRRVVVWDPPRSLLGLPVKGNLPHPMKAEVDEQEAVAINQLQLHTNLVTIHLAIERQLIRCCALEFEVGLPASPLNGRGYSKVP